jgi:parallel beta-helix repeat protein
MSKKLVLAAAATALGVSALGFGAAPGAATVACDRYAATTGSDAAAGSAAAPFRTAQKLLDSLSAGQTGCLASGTYGESLRVNHGGSQGSPIRLTSAPGERATVVGRLYVPAGSNDVVFADLNLNGANASDLPSPTVDADRVTLTGDDITNGHTAICLAIGSLDWGTAHDVVLDGNRIHDCGRLPYGSTNHDHGIYIESARRVVITNNYIYDNADRGIQLYPDAQGTTISNNVIDGNGEGIIFSGDSGLASSDNVASRNIISNSRVRYNVESWWPSGNPVGTGNVASSNCLWNGTQGNVADQVGFTASGNSVTNPLFADRNAKNFSVPAGSACAADVPSGGTTANAPQTIPAPPAAPVAPASVTPPALSGTARSGSALGATAGKWSGTAPLTFAYAWQRCDRTGATCTATGVTSSSYMLGTADVGSMLRVVVTATNAAGSASATSSVSGIVQSKSKKSALSIQRAKKSGLRRFLLRR